MNILTDKEKRYLKNVIEIYEDWVTFVYKNLTPNKIITIIVEKDENNYYEIELPIYNDDYKFEKVEVNKFYTLGMLGLKD